MKLIAERSRPAPLPREAAPPPTEQDHDLPVLAAEEHPRPNVDWETLLPTGMQPALALGAERRWKGSR